MTQVVLTGKPKSRVSVVQVVVMADSSKLKSRLKFSRSVKSRGRWDSLFVVSISAVELYGTVAWV